MAHSASNNFGLLVHVLPGPNKRFVLNQARFWAELGGKIISPAASFVLPILLTKPKLFNSLCPFGQIDNRKQSLERFRSHFETNYWRVDFKRASRPIHFCDLDLMGHRWPKVMAIWRCFPNEILTIIFDLEFEIAFVVIARASRPNKRRLCKPSMHSTFSWHTLNLSS